MRLSDIDLRLLRVFQAVAHAGGFAKAQGELGISQPAISTQIAKLEDRLNVRLCDRGPAGFSLTAAGRAALQETERLLAALDASAMRLNAISILDQKIARIGVVDCMVTDPNNPLLSVMRKMRELMPDLKIQIGVYDFLACIDELDADRLDIAIVGIAGDEAFPKAVETNPLYQEVSSLYCSADHPCASIDDPDALKDELVRSDISAHSFVFNPIDSEFDPKLLDHSGGVAQDNIELTAYLTLSGSHVGCLPDHYARPWVETGELVSLGPLGPTIISDFHAVRSRTKNIAPHLDQIWHLLDLASTGPI
jgi:DNA-binding transcriptional LysR family regulator